jgi:hypothetical protein
MSQTSTLIQEDNKNVIKTHMNNIYTNYFYDNREVVRYLKNIDNSNNLNWFDTMILKIFKFKVPEQVLGNDHFYTFINNANGEIKSTGRYESYRKIIRVLSTVIAVLYDIVMEGDKTRYKTITSLTFTSSELLPSNTDINCTGQNTKSKTSEYNSINYCLKSDGALYIRYVTDPSDFAAFTAPIDKNTLVYNPTSELEADIGKNYIFFMLNFADNNLEKQIAAFYYYMQIVNDCFKFYANLERMVISYPAGANSTIPDDERRANVCTNIFSRITPSTAVYKYESNLISLDGEIENFINENTKVSLSDTSKCTNVCPLEFTLSSSNIYMKDLPDDFIENYAVRVDTDKYDIKEITESVNEPRYLNKVKIKATGNTEPNADKSGCIDFPLLNIDMNAQKTIYFDKKSVDELRNEYNDIGDKLDNINENIEKAKDKINSQVKQYDAQSSILKALDTREYVYYAIFGVVGVVLLILLLIDTQQSTKTYASLTILIVLLAMNIINYYLKYDYIEHFDVGVASDGAVASGAYTPPVAITDCSNIQDGWQLSQKVNIMNPHIQQYTNRMITVLVKLKALLSSLNTEDFLSKIATSLKNEKRTYEEHSKVYKQRTEINKKSIDVMKHEMINKNAYINMITITSFVIVFVYVMFMLDPSYVNVYLVIGTILILINLAVYYILILHPVRTKSRNKYWYTPSKNTMQMIT